MTAIADFSIFFYFDSQSSKKCFFNVTLKVPIFSKFRQNQNKCCKYYYPDIDMSNLSLVPQFLTKLCQKIFKFDDVKHSNSIFALFDNVQ